MTRFSSTLYPIAVAITDGRMASNRVVAASATLLLSYGIGSVIGPIVMAQLVAVIGPQGLLMGNAGVVLLLAAATRYRIASTRDVPGADQQDFVTAMPESPAVPVELDPRMEEFHYSP